MNSQSGHGKVLVILSHDGNAPQTRDTTVHPHQGLGLNPAVTPGVHEDDKKPEHVCIAGGWAVDTILLETGMQLSYKVKHLPLGIYPGAR